MGFELHDPNALLASLCALPREANWAEFKHNAFEAESVGKYVSGLANAAMLEREKYAYMVWGIEDATHTVVGTNIRIDQQQVGAESFLLWLNKYLRPKINVHHKSFDVAGKHIEMLVIEPGYIHPVSFRGHELIRIDTSLVPLRDHTEKARALWAITSSYSFENATIATHMSGSEILSRFSVAPMLQLLKQESKSSDYMLGVLHQRNLIRGNAQGGFEVSALLAMCCAKDLNDFSLLENRGARVIVYKGTDKMVAIDDQEGQRGYLVRFRRLLKYILERIPSQEVLVHGVRTRVYSVPENAIREFLANCLIHQDFTSTGSRPTVEIYKDRVRFINPGKPIIPIERFIDGGAVSRNPNFARLMRHAGLCEERGSGVDRAVLEIERAALPPPLFDEGENSTSVTAFMPRRFQDMTSDERVRACFQHAQICHERNDAMSNSSLRSRFGLSDKQISQVSLVIRDTIAAGKIKPQNEDQAPKFARYVPAYA